MRGWKTWAGAILMAAASGVELLPYEWADPMAQAMRGIAAAFLGIGIGHKIEKGVLKILNGK